MSMDGSFNDWVWEEAFDKFGFEDGDGEIMTFKVEEVLQEAGYKTESRGWRMHNTIIYSITKNGKEFMPAFGGEHTVGYDCPRNYLPAEIIELLDEELIQQEVNMTNKQENNIIAEIIKELKEEKEITQENLEIISILGPDQGYNLDDELWEIAKKRGLLQTENYCREMEAIEGYSDGISYALRLLEGTNEK